MRRIFWSALAAAMMLWIVWELLFERKDLLPYLILSAALFAGLASRIKETSLTENEKEALAWLRPPFIYAEKLYEFGKDVFLVIAILGTFAMIFGSTFVDWNKWGPAVAQVAIVGIVASSLGWISFSKHLETHKHRHLLFWAAWIAAALVLGLLINRLLYLLPLVYLFFSGNWREENEKINSYHHTPSH